MRVLLIDSNEGFRGDAVSLMENIPFVERAVGAASFEEATTILHGTSPLDVVLLALARSEGPGPREIRAIRNSPHRPRVVAMTVFSEPDYLPELSGAGAHDWMPKCDFAAAILPCLLRSMSAAGPHPSDPHPPMASEVFRDFSSPAGR